MNSDKVTKDDVTHDRPDQSEKFDDPRAVEDWRVIGDGACAYFQTGSFAASCELVEAISKPPGVEDDLPDVDLRHDGVTVRLIMYTDNYYGMSRARLEMARQISAAARRLGLFGAAGGASRTCRHPGRPLPPR